MKLRTTKFILVASAVGLALGTMGCTVETHRQPVVYADDGVAYEEVGPTIDINTYPHEVYEGRNVYYVNNRWYYHDGGRWAYYRREPAPLNRHRVYVREAPRAHHDHERR
jgi:hypothetical protein